MQKNPARDQDHSEQERPLKRDQARDAEDQDERKLHVLMLDVLSSLVMLIGDRLPPAILP